MSITKNKTTGKWIAKGTVCLPDGTKRHYNRQFGLKRDAAAYEAKRREELQHENPSMTLDAFVIQQDERDKTRIKESSLITRNSYYRNQIQPAFGSKKLAAITAPMVERWYTDLCQHASYHAGNQSMDILSAYLHSAIRLDLIQVNPCSKIRRVRKDPNTVESDSPDNYWTPEEYQAFIDTCPDFRHLEQVRFLWATGARIGECIALQWRDVSGDIIQIRQTRASVTGKITSPKTENSARKIVLDAGTAKMLEERKERMSRIEGFSNEWFVFGAYRPQGMTSFRQQFAKMFELHPELHKITPHGLRHSHASLLINNGVNDMVIADRLGHTVDMLHHTYAHLYDKQRQDLRRILNDLV